MLFVYFALVGATAAIDCIYKGRTYKNGDRWIELNAFTMRCTTGPNFWNVDIANCLTPDGKEVEVGTSKTSGNWEYHCEKQTSGTVGLRQTVAKKANCKGIHAYGSIWVERRFKFRCSSFGESVLMGCVNKEGETITAGATKVIGLLEYECRQYSNGTVTFHARTAPKTKTSVCFDSTANVIRQPNEVYISGINDLFQMRCVSGEPTIIGCKMTGMTTLRILPVEKIEELNGYRHSCVTENDGIIRYRWEQIGNLKYVLPDARI